MKKSLRILLFLLLGFVGHNHAGTIYSFEDGTIPSGFKVKTGSLAIQLQKGKLGSKSLQWNWIGGDTLIAAPTSMNTASIQTNGGITVWIYNGTPSGQKLTMWFYEYVYSTTRRCSLDVSLNFKGWRCVWARFRADMGHAGYTLRSMKWEAPKTGSGTILIDYLEFVNDVSWERISDMQYQVNNNSSELENFVEIRNTIPATPPTSITSEERTAIQTIRQRVDDWHLGTGKFSTDPQYLVRKSAFDSYVNTALNKTSSLTLTTQPDGIVNGPGLYPVDFYGLTIDGSPTLTFREINEKYLIQLTYDAIKNKRASSRDLILKIFDWYYDQGWADGSGLGRLRFEMLRSSGFFHSTWLMRDSMPENQFNKVLNAEKWLTMFGKIYQTPENPGETADQIRALLFPKLMVTLSIKDELERAAALQSFVNYANNAFTIAPGYLGSIKPDFSGYHHLGPYYSAYYPDVLYIGALICNFLSGTPYALSEQTFNNLKNALLTFSFLCADYTVPAATTGRFPTQTLILDNLLPAYAYLALSATTPDPELTAAFKRLWEPTEDPLKSYIARAKSDITFKNSLGEVEKMVELAGSDIVAEKNPVGTKFLPYSGLLVARRPNWVLTAKGYSKYIWDFESSSSENLYGRYLSYGQIELSKLGTNIHSYQASQIDWDWSHIPGTTVKYLTKAELNSQLNPNLMRNFSDDPFLGGVAFDANTSVFSNSLHDNTFDVNFKARKSVFQFDSVFYCMGSGIKNSDRNFLVHTTLFQNLKLSSGDRIMVNDIAVGETRTGLMSPVLKDNYGNAYLVKDGNVQLDFGSSFITGYINHGRVQTNGKYAYMIIPDATAESMALYTKTKNPALEIIQNSSNAHIIRDNVRKTLSAVIFNPDSISDVDKLICVNIPSIIVMQERNDTLELAFTDPDMHRPSAANISSISPEDEATEGMNSSIQIDLVGNYEKISSDSEITVQNETAKTHVEFNNLKDGKTYRILLRNLYSSIKENMVNTVNVVSTTDRNVYRIETGSQKTFNFRLYNLLGEKMNEKKNLVKEELVSLNEFPRGMYLLNINLGNKELNVKIIRF